MKIKHLVLPVAVATIFSACSDDDDDGRVAACPAVGNLNVVELSNSRCQLSGTLLQSASIGDAVEWELEGGFKVGDGTNAVTLTINPGTTIYGDDVDAIDYLFVTSGSAIQANGTGARPIRMLSDDAGVNGSGEWGGLFIRGTGENILDYVVVAEAGADVTVAGTTYNNNIVLNGNDENTRLTFVQSHDSAGDGIRIQNGSPRLSWILVTGAQRDGIWYRDFSGLIKDLMVIHRPDLNDQGVGRAGIYASESTASGDFNPRIVNATLVGRDGTSEDASNDPSAREFGILFADNTDQGRFSNILIANFRNGCYETSANANLSGLPAVKGGNIGYLDGIHCANNAGPNPGFGVVRADTNDLTLVGRGNGMGLRYYNGNNTPILFTGMTGNRDFTAGWYLFQVGAITNGLAADPIALNGFNRGDTNNDGVTNTVDIGFAPFLNIDVPFNQDVGDDTNGYDLTHIGSVRSGSDSVSTQFNDWTVATGLGEGFAVVNNNTLPPEVITPIQSTCPATVGNLVPVALDTQDGRNRCEITGMLTLDATIDSSADWVLGGALQVGNQIANTTLTIAGGTTILGGLAESPQAENPDYVLVAPGSSIQAMGSGSNPILMVSDDADMNGSGEWGGLIITGGASNVLDYVVVAEGGAQVVFDVGFGDRDSNENILLINNTEDTRLTFVQSHDSARDGIRIVNGNPRLSWILVTGAARDGIWYQDFTGLIKDLLVIHRPDAGGAESSGRAGIYASASALGVSNPRIVNATLVGRDNSSEDASNDPNAREFGILFADDTRDLRYANILIANFRNGCYEIDSTSDLSGVTTSPVSTSSLDGVHCANEAGPNSNFGVVRSGGENFVSGLVGNGNGSGLRYYNGELNPITFTGETAARPFTSGWYLFTLGSITNGLAADAQALNGFNQGDTNNDGVTNTLDIGFAPFLDSSDPFDQDVGDDTGGYDLTHVGGVRSGSRTSASNRQFDGWTIQTSAGQGFAVPVR
ncbi:Uncharacterised protein [BD1-7 clade bacterium]|uniref:Lipoprotein n=1 Tax=BD1-7 clade bacterium TaxID=2029982 RepID=A0A5S9P634_9GAMM|nr:Uncharacterised protein [BD1-7 clade bacterium]